MPRRACKKDGNHDEIRDTLKALGWDVIESYQFAQYVPGFPDLIAFKRDRVVFVEIKTADEQKWNQGHWRAEYVVIRTTGNCEMLNEQCRGEA